MFTLGIVTNNHEENENEASQHSIRSAYQFSSPSYYFFFQTDTLIEKSNNQMKSAMKSLSLVNLDLRLLLHFIQCIDMNRK